MIACGSLCFSQLPFDRACAEIASLGFQGVDVAVMEGWAHFSPSKLVESLDEQTRSAEQSLSRHRLKAVAFNASAGTSETSAESERFRAICAFAANLGVRVICYAAPVEAVGLDRALRRYERLRDLAVERGMTLAVEAHARTLLERPAVAVDFCERIEGLRLTFDPSHLYAGAHQGAPFEELYPYVRHTHWRDSGTVWEQCQVPVGRGVVDFEGIIERLREEGYDGAYAVEYIDTFPNGGKNQVRAMKRKLEELFAAP